MSVVLPAPFGPITACVSPLQDVEIHPVGGDEAAERLRQPAHREQGVSHRRTRRAGGRTRPRLAKSTTRTRNGPRMICQCTVQAGQEVLEQQQHHRAHHGPDQRAHAAQDDHEHDLAGARPVHEVRGEVLRLVDEQRAGQPAHGAGDDEGHELVAIGREADGARPRLVGLRRAHDQAEPGVDEPVAEEEQRPAGSPARRSRTTPAREVHQAAEPAARGSRMPLSPPYVSRLMPR